MRYPVQNQRERPKASDLEDNSAPQEQRLEGFGVGGAGEAALSHWEERALAAMVKGLESPRCLEPGPALSPKLERLLARQALQQNGRMAKLEKRLAKLQEPKSPPPTK